MHSIIPPAEIGMITILLPRPEAVPQRELRGFSAAAINRLKYKLGGVIFRRWPSGRRLQSADHVEMSGSAVAIASTVVGTKCFIARHAAKS
ncbi:hypothetical protein EVAR_79292_1 [Eumeta japonica]|uniref:Uncharacterized protein n=1 Tax=Eumeta variegata TaxID=151549 RepID=A0A4C1TFG1_EUMVA|nr:hypothetical protein EVAR_79292_1 [Eumeta japonica]